MPMRRRVALASAGATFAFAAFLFLRADFCAENF